MDNISSDEDVMPWTDFLHYWPFVLGNHQLLVDSQHKGQVMQSFDGFFDVNLDILFNKQMTGQLSEIPEHSCGIISMRAKFFC